MANKIQVKRGVEANIPILDVGEPAFTTDTKKLFIGTDTGNMELATKQQINNLDAEKVDKVEGKGLSTNDYTNTEKAEVAKVVDKADKTYVDTLVANVASGSPKGVYETLAALEAALPTGDTGIYVVTADGFWYYWDIAEEEWTPGGIYLSTELSDALTVQDEEWSVV